MRQRPKTRWPVLLWLLVAAACSAAPGRVVSINLCSDQLLMMLARPGQIRSISHLSRDPRNSLMAAQAARYPENGGRLEELLLMEPDLVLAFEFSPPALLRQLHRLGYRVLVVPAAHDLPGIRHNIRQVARALGNPQAGEQLLAEMDRQLAAIGTGGVRGERPGALFYQPRGYTSGRETLQDSALKMAGWRNLAAEMGITGYRPLDLERLILARPDQLFTSPYAPGTDSLAQRLLQHPALRRLTGGRPLITIDYRYWICGGPMIVDAIKALALARATLPR